MAMGGSLSVVKAVKLTKNTVRSPKSMLSFTFSTGAGLESWACQFWPPGLQFDTPGQTQVAVVSLNFFPV